MGVVSDRLSREAGGRAHNSVGSGGMGTQMAQTRFPDLNILDAIWINANPYSGPSTSYAGATRRNELVASRDPVAADVWAVKNILVPQMSANGYASGDYAAQDPDNSDSTFRRYLDRSMNEMLVAQIPCTNNYQAARLWVFSQAAPIPALSTVGATLLAMLLLCCGVLIARKRAFAYDETGAGEQ